MTTVSLASANSLMEVGTGEAFGALVLVTGDTAAQRLFFFVPAGANDLSAGSEVEVQAAVLDHQRRLLGAPGARTFGAGTTGLLSVPLPERVELRRGETYYLVLWARRLKGEGALGVVAQDGLSANWTSLRWKQAGLPGGIPETLGAIAATTRVPWIGVSR